MIIYIMQLFECKYFSKIFLKNGVIAQIIIHILNFYYKSFINIIFILYINTSFNMDYLDIPKSCLLLSLSCFYFILNALFVLSFIMYCFLYTFHNEYIKIYIVYINNNYKTLHPNF